MLTWTVLHHCRELWHRHQTRRALRHLDDDQLRDIGITREQAIRESRKRVWQK